MERLEKINKFVIREGSKVLGYALQFSEYITEVRVMGGFYEYMGLKKRRILNLTMMNS